MKSPALSRTGPIRRRFGIRHNPLEAIIQRAPVLLSARWQPAIFVRRVDATIRPNHYGQ
jgi:hypothetical protein